MGKFFKYAKKNPLTMVEDAIELATKNYNRAANRSDWARADKYWRELDRLYKTDIGKSLHQVETKAVKIRNKMFDQRRLYEIALPDVKA